MMNRKRRLTCGRTARGMTLIEIMVVLTILGLIAAAVGVAVIPRLQEARIDRAKLDIGNIQNGLKLYYARKGKFPDTSTGLKGLMDLQVFDSMPKDPWDNEYIYAYEGGKPVITSYGADGQPGGEGPDSDIASNSPGDKK